MTLTFHNGKLKPQHHLKCSWSLVLVCSHPSLTCSVSNFARHLSTQTHTYPASQDMALDNQGVIDLHPKKNWLCHTGVTTFHKWKVRRRILMHRCAEDLKASWTLYSNAGCPLSKGINSGTISYTSKRFLNFTWSSSYTSHHTCQVLQVSTAILILAPRLMTSGGGCDEFTTISRHSK
jgi:hypothetical protein